MDLQLQQKIALVVGGSGLIGAAVVRRLREEGATVLVATRHPEEGGVELDGRDPASVQRAVDAIVAEHGRIDVLVVTAAPSARTLDPARNADPDQVADALDGKALVFLRIANAVIPHMREAGSGRVVVVSGQNAFITGSITGSVRNAATILIAKNLADALAGTGVAVNAVNPGRHRASRGGGAARLPGESSPAQIADLIAFLASPRSAVSGESIAIGHRVRGVTAL